VISSVVFFVHLKTFFNCALGFCSSRSANRHWWVTVDWTLGPSNRFKHQHISSRHNHIIATFKVDRLFRLFQLMDAGPFTQLLPKKILATLVVGLVG
jgi:hypothetical protein